MRERLAIVGAARTPFCKMGTSLKDVSASELGAIVAREALERSGLSDTELDQVIFGNVCQPPDSANIARVIAVKAGFGQSLPAFTVNRNCASGMQSISSAADMIGAGEAKIVLCGGTESMSQIPFFFRPEMVEFLAALQKAKTFSQKLKVLSRFRPGYLKPVIGLVQGLTDPTCNLIMGLTAEKLAKEFHITRQEQDEYSLLSHQRASAALKDGVFEEEIVPVPIPPEYDRLQRTDIGPRENQTLAALAKLKPYFDRKNGTVTAGNSSQITDGAAAVVVMSESEASRRGIRPIAYLREYAYAGLDPSRMGLGPVFATAALLKKTGLSFGDIDLVELNEAFAAVVIANERAFQSAEFAKRELGMEEPVGFLDREKLNVNGGGIALGHPVGATGTRLVITLLRELKKRNLSRGLATLCVGGGQGAALLLEVE